MTDDEVVLGHVKFWLREKGWGAIVSPDLPFDVFASFAVIDAPGYRTLDEGDPVEFRYEECWGGQTSWHYRSTWVRRLDAAR